MTAATLPLPRLLLTVSGWGQRPQQDGIASLVEENRGLNEPRGGAGSSGCLTVSVVDWRRRPGSSGDGRSTPSPRASPPIC